MKIFTKKIFAVATALFLLQWVGFAPQAYSYGEDLNYYQERMFLMSAERFCWDTWCEGEYLYDFLSFACSFDDKKCLLTYSITDKNNSENYEEYECTVPIDSVYDLKKTVDKFTYLEKEVDSCF